MKEASANYPKIINRSRTPVSQWVDLIEKTVQFSPDQTDVYHCISQNAYVGILARTADALIPIVQQYRPCVEQFTWEFPAGTVDPGESAEAAARRELTEETGFEVDHLTDLGEFFPDTGRLQINSYAFYATISQLGSALRAEEGMSARLVTHRELKRMIIEGEFQHQLHVAIYGIAVARGICLD